MCGDRENDDSQHVSGSYSSSSSSLAGSEAFFPSLGPAGWDACCFLWTTCFFWAWIEFASLLIIRKKWLCNIVQCSHCSASCSFASKVIYSLHRPHHNIYRTT